jgi:hypothetical protein
MPAARQLFQETFRPAVLLLGVYRLLDNDGIHTEGVHVEELRKMLGVKQDEELLLVLNDVFLGLVREAAEVRKGELRRESLKNLLRQAVVSGSTAMESFVQFLLRDNLVTVIRLKGRDFFPADKEVRSYFLDFQFSLDNIFRILEGAEEDPHLFVANKILGHFKYKNLGSEKAIKTAGMMLGLDSPWRQIAAHLDRDESELVEVIRKAFDRRNDIVHRGDWETVELTGDRQDINYQWTEQAVLTIRSVCETLDELVSRRIEELKVAREPQEETSRR